MGGAWEQEQMVKKTKNEDCDQVETLCADKGKKTVKYPAPKWQFYDCIHNYCLYVKQLKSDEMKKELKKDEEKKKDECLMIILKPVIFCFSNVKIISSFSRIMGNTENKIPSIFSSLFAFVFI